MRRPDRSEIDLFQDQSDSGVRVEKQVTAPHSLSLGDPTVEAGNVAEPTWATWRAELAAIGGYSPLIHFVDTPRTRIELSSTHPGGLAQFITGKTTLLSSLIRDEVALRGAKIAAGELTAKGVELSTARGIDSIHLGIGIAEWTHAEIDYRAPILLRPLAIRRHGRDFELKLRGATYLNPELARVLDGQFQIALDAHAFVALTDDDGTFKPNPVIDRLRGLTSHLNHFAVYPRLVASSFADVASAMVADTADLTHPVLDALAGNPSARWAVAGAYSPVEPSNPDTREPSTDVLLLDADAEQEHVIAQVSAGNSVVVNTLPGTGGTQTIVNTIGSLVGQNKRVLVVSPHRASLRSISQRLSDIGLPGLAVAPRTLRRDVVRSIARNERARQPFVGEVDEALVRLRTVLLDYRAGLHKSDPVLQISVLDCVTELSRLALLPTPPSTTARLSRSAVEILASDRHRAAGIMVAAAKLGEFKYGPGDSPWYGAHFTTGEDALAAHAIAKRLHEDELPRLLVRAHELIGSTHLRPFETIAELGIYLRLLSEVRDTLDKFVPSVFDRSLTELIAATAPRSVAPDMTRANRRRLKKLAKEYIRPGVSVGDLHDALTRIQQQRVLWQRFAIEGVTPGVPVGIGDAQAAFQRVSLDLAALDAPLGHDSLSSQFNSTPIERLLGQIEALAAESDVLENLTERTALMHDLAGLQLDPLIQDLAVRHVPDEQVEAELELSWWQSALESLLEADHALLNANTSVLDRLEADFRLVDEAHSAGSASLLAWQLSETWKIGLVDWPDEAQALKRILSRDGVQPGALHAAAPHLSRAISPVWLASPYEVHTIPDSMPFDTVILVDAGATTLAESVSAIRRAKQVVAFGDSVTQMPAPFALAVRDPDASTDPTARSADTERLYADSTVARLATLLPTLELTRSYRAGGEDLAELVNRRFYGGKIESLPWAGSFLGHGSLSLEYVENGTGMPDADSGSVESVDAEVERVMELILEHVAHRPRESLMVITASTKHAVRVEQAVLTAASTRSDLTDFLLAETAEPFAVLTVEQAVAHSRDRVIFSIGFGRTPHGRVLSDFGTLGEPGGERLVASAMTRARRSMVIVTCFEPADIEEGRMQNGAIALAGILGEIRARGAAEPLQDDSDPMLVDLARRLEKRGLRAALGHRGKLGLVTSHLGVCVTVETDSVLHKASLRESLRLRPELLRRLGWHYVRVHAFELFSDPDAVADRICAVAGAPVGLVTEEIPIIPVHA